MSIFYGESTCISSKRNGVQCTNKAYYLGGLCGVHSSDKIKLPINPSAGALKAKMLSDRTSLVEKYAVDNRKSLFQAA